MKIGFITKFPVDFYDTMIQGAKDWNKDHPEVTLIFAQGASGTDDEGEINAIQSMVTQGVKAIAITPTSPNVQDELQKAVDDGIVVVLVDNDIPDWDGKALVVATDNLAGGKLAGEFMKGQVPAGAQIGILGVPALVRPASSRGWGRLRHRVQAADRLRSDQGSQRGAGHADGQPGRRRHLRRLWPADHRCARGDRHCRQDDRDVGFDAGPDEITAILAGTETASVAQFPAKMGELGADTAFKAANGEDVPPNVDTGTATWHQDTRSSTKDNAADFQCAPGAERGRRVPGRRSAHLDDADRRHDDPHQRARCHRRALPDLPRPRWVGRDESRARLLRRLPRLANRRSRGIGCSLLFTTGRGNDVACAAIDAHPLPRRSRRAAPPSPTSERSCPGRVGRRSAGSAGEGRHAHGDRSRRERVCGTSGRASKSTRCGTSSCRSRPRTSSARSTSPTSTTRCLLPTRSPSCDSEDARGKRSKSTSSSAMASPPTRHRRAGSATTTRRSIGSRGKR